MHITFVMTQKLAVFSRFRIAPRSADRGSGLGGRSALFNAVRLESTLDPDLPGPILAVKNQGGLPDPTAFT
jgi:hypothetical protein